MTPDELAAIVAALAALERAAERAAPRPAVSRWRAAARVYGDDA